VLGCGAACLSHLIAPNTRAISVQFASSHVSPDIEYPGPMVEHETSDSCTVDNVKS
jgi:hypothetical protein